MINENEEKWQIWRKYINEILMKKVVVMKNEN